MYGIKSKHYWTFSLWPQSWKAISIRVCFSYFILGLGATTKRQIGWGDKPYKITINYDLIDIKLQTSLSVAVDKNPLENFVWSLFSLLSVKSD